MLADPGDLPMKASAAFVLFGASVSAAGAQESFTLYERNAMAGNYTAQRNAAFCLRTAKCEGVIVPRMIDACAWRMVILGSGHHWVNQSDLDNYTDECLSELSGEERAAALSRAEQWFRRIYKRSLPLEKLPP